MMRRHGGPAHSGLHGLRRPWRLRGLLVGMVIGAGVQTLAAGAPATQAGVGAGPASADEPSAPAAQRLILTPCRLDGLPTEARCGVLRRPLDAAQPQGRQFDLQVAVLPALSRQRLPDPVVVLAGGPGQSAIELAGPLSQLLARFQNRRDMVLVDQRGTGRSAPLRCDDEAPTRALRDSSDPARQLAALRSCREQLMRLPHGDLRHYTTPEAMADLEAVRLALGLGPVNLVGASYGTRAALEYLRQYPGSVRRAVLDGVAPPDMVLPLSMASDTQAALDALLRACEHSPECRRQYPRLRADWQALAQRPPHAVTLTHPLTGTPETLVMTPDMLHGLVRGPLYSPVLASALPLALTQAAQGHWDALLGLNAAGGGGGGRAGAVASGMHFSVVCAEDAPRWEALPAPPSGAGGVGSLALYQQVCADWPRGQVPAAFYRMPVTPVPTLLLSGGQDPATPPRHGERVAQALGAQAVHVVVPQAGHGVMATVPCWREAVFRFIDAATPAQALQQARADAACAADLPRPPALLPLQAPGPGPAAVMGHAVPPPDKSP